MMIEDDIYGNLENFNDENNYNDLKKENEGLRDEVENLKLKIEELTEENLLVNQKFKNYESNISSLLMTARIEVERKDRIIADFNKEKDELVLRKFNHQNSSSKFNHPKHDENKDTGPTRKGKKPEHDNVVKLKVNNQVLDKQQLLTPTDSNTDQINTNAIKSMDDKNCLQKLIIEMEEETSCNRTKTSKIQLNRRKSICSYKVEDKFEDTKFNLQLNAVKHEINELENNTNSCRETNRNKRLSSLENNKLDQDNKYAPQNDILKCNISENPNKAVKIEANEKKTVCDSTTHSPKRASSNVLCIPKTEQESSETNKLSEQRNAFKIQRNRRQSMNEDIKRDFSPEKSASVHYSRRNICRDDFHTRRARNASCDRQRDLHVSREYHTDPRNATRESRPNSRVGSHDRYLDPHIISHDSRSDLHNGSYKRRPDPRITTHVSQRDPRNAARDKHSDQRNVAYERRPDSRYASRDHRCRERRPLTRDSERFERNNFTQSHSKERSDVETHTRYRSKHTPTESHTNLISTKRIDEQSSNVGNNVSVDEKNSEDIANTLSLRYSDSEESNSNQNFKELDSRQKISEDLRQFSSKKISNLESNSTLGNRNTFQSSTVKSANNNINQCSLLNYGNDVYAYISNLSHQSTERKTPLDSLFIDKGSLADTAPTFHLYQDYSGNPATSGYTIMSPDEQNQPQIVDKPQNEKEISHFASKNKPISFMEYAVHRIDYASSVSCKPLSNTDFKDTLAVISSGRDPREKQFTQNVSSDSKLEHSQKTYIRVDDDSIDQNHIKIENNLLDQAHIKVDNDLLDQAYIKIDNDVLDQASIKVDNDLFDLATIKVDDDLLDEAHIKQDNYLLDEVHIKIANDDDFLQKSNHLVDKAACTASSLLKLKNIPNESIMKMNEKEVANNKVINILARKSPRKVINKYKIPKKQSSCKKDELEVPKLNNSNICSDLNDKKGLITKQKNQSSKIKDRHRKNENEYEDSGSNVSTDKQKSKSTKTPDAKYEENKKSTQTTQDTIVTSESMLSKALTAPHKDNKKSNKLTETSNIITKLESNNTKTVETHKKRSKKKSTTTSPNKKKSKLLNEAKEQTSVETTEKDNKYKENIEEIDSSKFETKRNEKCRKLNECLETVSISYDKTLPSESKNNENVTEINSTEITERAKRNRSGAEKDKNKSDKMSEKTVQTQLDQPGQNEDNLHSSQSEPAHKRRKLYSHDNENTSNSNIRHNETFSNKHDVGAIVVIKQDAPFTPPSVQNVNDKKHDTKDQQYPKISRIKKKGRSVIIRCNDMCEDEPSKESTLKVNDEDIKKEVPMKDTKKPDLKILMTKNSSSQHDNEKIHIKEEETSLKILQKVDNLNTKTKNNKMIEDFPQCHTVQHTNSAPKTLVDKQPGSQPDSTSIPTNDGNYIIKITRKRKIVKTF